MILYSNGNKIIKIDDTDPDKAAQAEKKAKKNGYGIRIVIPDDLKCDDTVELKTFYSGRGGLNGKACLGESLYTANDGNYISVTISSSPIIRGGNPQTLKVGDLITYLKQNGYKVPKIDNDTYSGVSLGGLAAISKFQKKLGKTDKPLNLNLYDPVTTKVGELPKRFTPEQRKQMKKNGSKVRLITIASRASAKKPLSWLKSAGIKKLVKSGVSVLLISGNDKKNKNGVTPNGHEQCYKLAVKTGWEDFFDGTIELTDIKNSVMAKDGKEYNLDYQIHIPYVDENGKVKWKKYALSYLQDMMKNYLDLDDTEQRKLESIMSYIYSNRAAVNFNIEDGLSDLGNVATSLLSSCEESTGISITGISKLLPTEATLIAKSYSKALENLTSIRKTNNSEIQAIEDYESLEKDLDRDVELL